MTLDEFLLARIAEDEEQARAMTRWPTFEMPFHRLYDDDPEVQADFDAKDHAKTLARLLATHGIPARVLAECEAKRQVVDMFSGNLHEKWDDGHEVAKVADALLRTIASVYADHPDYRQEWRP